MRQPQTRPRSAVSTALPSAAHRQCGYRQVAVHEIEILSEPRDFCYGVVVLIELTAVVLTDVTGTTIIDVSGLPKEVPIYSPYGEFSVRSGSWRIL